MKSKSRTIISEREVDLLFFLWRHRVSTFQTLRQLFYPSTGAETAYNRLRRLRAADFVGTEYTEGNGKTVWCLGERGFRLLEAMRLPDLKSKGYRPSSPTHDLLVMGALLGEWYQKTPSGVSVITEQELLTTEPSGIPAKVLENFKHRPDGLWLTTYAREPSAIALEVEISGKSVTRYEETCSFYGGFHFIENVVWIVPDRSLAKKIQTIASATTMPRDGQNLFVLLEDFESKLWDAKILNASLKGMSMSGFLRERLERPDPSTIGRSIGPLIEDCSSKPRGPTKSPLLDCALSIERFNAYIKLRKPPDR